MGISAAAKWAAILIRAHRDGDQSRKRAAQQKLERGGLKLFFGSELLKRPMQIITNDEIGHALALRPRHAARALSVSERQLWQWTHDGKIPHCRVGRTILYPVDGLRDWLSRQSTCTGGTSA